MEFVSGLSLDKLKSPKLADLVLIAYQVSTGIGPHAPPRTSYTATSHRPTSCSRRQARSKSWATASPHSRTATTPASPSVTPHPSRLKDKEITEKSDIYNFGATFYHLLTSRARAKAA